ncbi:MAG TPA: hypothetical protein VNZ94_10000 [Xanthobacteraceae bacterium]|nr:hypothetical protein [Xanthobacteraceae bacterium]
MMKRVFGKRCSLAIFALVGAALFAGAAEAQKLIKKGDLLTGELNLMQVRVKGHAKRVDTFHMATEARRLLGAGGMCNLETGPETFQIVTHSDEEVARLRSHIGKVVSIKVKEVSCAREAGQFSDALVTKWTMEN